MTQILYEDGTCGTTVKILKILASLVRPISDRFCFAVMEKYSFLRQILLLETVQTNGCDRQRFCIYFSMGLGMNCKRYWETGLTIIVQSCTKTLISAHSGGLSPSDQVMREMSTQEYICLCSRQGEDQNTPDFSLASRHSWAWATQQNNMSVS